MGSTKRGSAEDVQLVLAKLQPEAMRRSLLRASLLITAFEVLQDSILDQVERFLTTAPTDDRRWRELCSRQHALSKAAGQKGPDRLRAALLWLVEMDGLTQAEADRVVELRNLRNKVVHELGNYVADPNYEIRPDEIGGAQTLLRRVSLFWARIEIELSDEWVGVEVKDEDIGSPIVDLLGMMVAAAESG
jgi:hypothetical protein